MNDHRSLVVFEKIAVRDLHIEPKRVRATYVLTQFDGHEVSDPLIYSYEHPVFDPSASEDVNLASMMLAQVAVNYGLFCKVLEFEGLFDQTDRRFLIDAIENTAREIYVNKFLCENEFIVPPFDALDPAPAKRYTNAEITFIGAGPAATRHTAHTASAYTATGHTAVVASQSLDTYAILSSGGKDSLLTYGLVTEIGEAHPVFINESGRHWYTAVNAHRFLKEHDTKTAKPWCNSDRVFNWMLRHMPFIRPDFTSVRADIYPIRLWTVAVFLFGVLPIVRKRGIGNVLIGNEYDTTLKGVHRGITHYKGLYDQSKYFDNALTRYYRKKGWGLYQFSMLRSLSELLIMKVLIERYPELQRHQVSCHAAHSENGRMRPCGNCEKCRRIIGMIVALGEDPARCGYTRDQVERGLHALEKKTVKQFGADAAQLYYLLRERNAIELNAHTRRLAQPHPEIMHLRFDRERSAMSDLPVHVRKPLFDILGRHVPGAVAWKDRTWHPLHLDDEFLHQPYFLDTS